MIEKQLKKQGIHGYPYRLMHGNTKEMMKLAMETNASSTRSSMEFPHDIWIMDIIVRSSYYSEEIQKKKQSAFIRA